MFKQLFAERGISLDRLRALVEVGAAGGIARAAGDDLVRQSLYSRQLKELEDFFQIGLSERHGKGIRLTHRGKELARISRFFLMGLSNFKRGCRAEAQHYRVGAGATFIDRFLIPGLGRMSATVRFEIETETDNNIERRLHDLTLDFGILQRHELSRPLQARKIGDYRLLLCLRAGLCRSNEEAWKVINEGRCGLVWPKDEMSFEVRQRLWSDEPSLTCGTFSQALRIIEQGRVGAFLPEYLLKSESVPDSPGKIVGFDLPACQPTLIEYFLAWNPRLVRLNPHSARQIDALYEELATQSTTKPTTPKTRARD